MAVNWPPIVRSVRSRPVRDVARGLLESFARETIHNNKNTHNNERSTDRQRTPRASFLSLFLELRC